MERQLTVSSCNLPIEADYMCETPSRADRKLVVWSDQGLIDGLEPPSKPTTTLPQRLAECRHGEMTQAFFLCDELSRCYGDGHRPVDDCLHAQPVLHGTML